MRLLQLLLSILLIGLLRAANAQSGQAPRVELDFDVRARTSADIAPRVALFTGSIQLQSSLAPGWHLDLYGAHTTSALLAIPTNGAFLAQQAAIEYSWAAQRLQAGIIRLPFGIYDNRETYASGIIDYPLARVDWAWASVNWGVQGFKYTASSPKLQLEAAGFGGQGAGQWNNHTNVGGGAIRLQTSARDLIAGLSRWDGYINADDREEVHLSGLDLRYTRPHLLLRGEYLLGLMGGHN
jgi:hypothetical protein